MDFKPDLNKKIRYIKTLASQETPIFQNVESHEGHLRRMKSAVFPIENGWE